MGSRELTNSATVTWDYSVPGQAKANVVGGGSIPNYWLVPSGSTWQETQAIITAAKAVSISSGIRQTVVLPDERIIVNNYLANNSYLLLDAPLRITGQEDSELFLNDTDVHPNGTDLFCNIQFVDGVELDHFKITYDRTALGSSDRKTSILVNWGAHNVDLHHLAINGSTSDIFRVNGEYLANNHEVNGVRIWANSAIDWYESYCILRGGDAFNVKVFDNVGTTTTGHPNSSISRPYGVGIGQEEFYALHEDILFADNHMDATGLSAGAGNPSLGVFCTWSNGGGGNIDNARVNRVVFKHNTAIGWYDNYFHRLINRAGTSGTAAFLSYEGNVGSDAIGMNFRLWPTDGFDNSLGEEDHLLIAKHVGGYNISLANLGPYPGPTITEIA